jgi:hypothetical protein
VQVSTLLVRDDVADPEIVGEPVGLHLLGEDLRRRPKLVHRLEILGEMPLSLIGGVVTSLPQHVPDRGEIGRHAGNPWEIRVVEHLRVLDVPAGIQDRARRRAHAGVDLVVLEDDSLLRQALVGR